MSRYQLLPDLDPEEYAALRADIAANGVRVPIDVDETGAILDGHHRRRIANQLEIDCPLRVIGGLSEAEKRAHALAVNLHRRTLTREQKRELIAASLAVDPELSDRQHAARTNADHKTVGSVRDEMVGRGEIPHVHERTDSAGRQQPAAKTRTAKIVNHETGEASEVEYISGAYAATAFRDQTPEMFVEKYPELAYYRELGRRTGADGKTVAAVRTEMEATAEIPQLNERTGSDGKSRRSIKTVPPVDESAGAVARWPELAFFHNRGEHDRVLRNAGFLDAYEEPELSVRREALAATIAAEQRAELEPPEKSSGPDYAALADEMFAAVNKAAQLVDRHGAAATVAAASASRMKSQLWAEHYEHFARRLDELAAASRPKIRRVK